MLKKTPWLKSDSRLGGFTSTRPDIRICRSEFISVVFELAEYVDYYYLIDAKSIRLLVSNRPFRDAVKCRPVLSRGFDNLDTPFFRLKFEKIKKSVPIYFSLCEWLHRHNFVKPGKNIYIGLEYETE